MRRLLLVTAALALAAAPLLLQAAAIRFPSAGCDPGLSSCLGPRVGAAIRQALLETPAGWWGAALLLGLVALLPPLTPASRRVSLGVVVGTVLAFVLSTLAWRLEDAGLAGPHALVSASADVLLLAAGVALFAGVAALVLPRVQRWERQRAQRG